MGKIIFLILVLAFVWVLMFCASLAGLWAISVFFPAVTVTVEYAAAIATIATILKMLF